MNSKIADDLATQQAARIDGILHDTIVKALGPDFIPRDLRSRVVVNTFEGDPSSVMVIDGKPVLQWWPPEFSTREEDGKFIATVTTKYRDLWNP